ncbi:unnamed protein product [Miscanthus lutarioriparius]|uniref:cytokinin riboside 5'-monophosphate phosphoribohydrolase n=1 Tax=Miscanthus lutarioriparius TaxID=422564 RepID=A0A811N917_9POAL|nr:unnamed protein product [Miscanthus lutarioriparius]
MMEAEGAAAENGGAGKESGSRFRRVCVFCGSSSGKRSSYRDAAVELGKELVGLLNVDGYYDFLLAFIDKAVDDGFIKPSQRHIFVSAPDARELVHKLEFMHDAFLTVRGNQSEYEPVQDEDPATPKLCWEIEQLQRLGCLSCYMYSAPSHVFLLVVFLGYVS